MTYLDPTKRHDFIWLFDCEMGNPNGDPDADNLPRTDSETMKGIVTDVCLKRKIRNYAEQVGEMDLFVQQGGLLNPKIQEARIETGAALSDKKDKKKRVTDAGEVEKMRDWMCRKYYDVRLFGAVMSTGENAGQVRGPIQIGMASSLHEISPQRMSITRCARTDEEEGIDNKTMGGKTYIPYGLYQTRGFYSPSLASQTGVDGTDLKLFWDVLIKCWEIDRSAARGFMATRKLIIFTHESKWGDIPTQDLMALVKVKQINQTPRSFNDFEVSLGDCPEPVVMTVF